MSCSVNGGSLELFFKLENEKDPEAWLKENLKEVEKVLKTFNLEIVSRDSNELGIKVPATFEDFGETVIDSLNELVPEVFFFEENYLDEEDSIWVVLLSVA